MPLPPEWWRAACLSQIHLTCQANLRQRSLFGVTHYRKLGAYFVIETEQMQDAMREQVCQLTLKGVLVINCLAARALN